VRLIPRAFFSIAVAVSIALTFAPLTLRQFEQIRAAQAVRGHRLRGLRDGLPLLLPLLIGGLERALQLAEAMTARGFAGTAAPAGETTTKLVLIVGLASVTAGWLLRLVWGQAVWGLLLMGAGAGLIAGRLWWLGRLTRPTVYRPTPWTKRDESVVLGAALAALALAWPWPDLDRSSIFYYPYPQLTWPTCHPLLAVATMGLLLPAVWRYRHKPAPLASPYPLADPEQR
jgi:energy-coupling factor transport system permease protein